jgi:hypothetical protein
VLSRAVTRAAGVVAAITVASLIAQAVGYDFPAWRSKCPERTATRPPCAGPPLVFCKVISSGLRGFAAVQKDKSHVIAWNQADETFRVFDHVSDAPVKARDIKRPLRCQHSKLFRRKAAVSRDFREHLFAGQSREASHSRADDRTERKNGLMDRHKVDDIAGFSTVGGRRGFIRGKVNGVRNVTKKFIRLGGEKPKVAVGDPLKLHSFTEALYLSLTFARLDFSP